MEKNTFVGESDRYNGITVDSQEEPCQPQDFIPRLLAWQKSLECGFERKTRKKDKPGHYRESFKNWRNENRRCIWFKVNIKDAALVPLLANEGFNFHHSRGEFVVMYKWLPTDCSSNLPPACHTNLGVGGMVFNDKNQILVVSENYHEHQWKLPGGYVERGEDIKDAAIREVKEETGIDATFESMVTMRHIHNMMFNNSDIYAIVKLKAISFNIEKSDIEIKACKWMDVEEFLNHPHVIKFNKEIVRQAFNLQDRKLRLNLTKIDNGRRPYTSLVLEDV